VPVHISFAAGTVGQDRMAVSSGPSAPNGSFRAQPEILGSRAEIGEISSRVRMTTRGGLGSLRYVKRNEELELMIQVGNDSAELVCTASRSGTRSQGGASGETTRTVSLLRIYDSIRAD
jgi:hypothetical protein